MSVKVIVMKNNKRIVLLIIVMLLLAACGRMPDSAEPVAGIPTLAPTLAQPTPTLAAPTVATDQVTVPPAVITETVSTPVTDDVLTPTLPPPPPAPTEDAAGGDGLMPAMPAQALVNWLLAQRQAGRTLDDVAEELLAAGVLYDTEANPVFGNGGKAFAAVDSAGSGEPFWALGLNRGPMNNGQLYEFWLLGTDHLALSFAGTEFAGMPPLLLATDDLSGDGLPDYLLEQTGCGAHTCFGTYWVYSHHGGVLSSRLNSAVGLARTVAEVDPRSNIMPEWPDRISMTSPVITITDLNGDSVADLHFRGGMISSVGAGIHQGFEQTWSWDDDQMVLSAFQWDYTGFRHHELYDGDFAARLGERDIAMSHYLRVMFDETLRDDYTLVSEEAEAHALARQIAGFRLMQLTELGQETWLAYLQSEYPDQPLTIAAQMYWENWLPGDDNDACEAVNQYLATQVEPLGSFGGQLGYGNPTLDPATFCWVAPDLEMEGQRPAARQEATFSDDPLVEDVIAAMLGHDSTALGQLLHLIERPCTHEPGPGALQCAEDEAEGTMIPSLLVAHCEGAVIRVDPAALPDFSGDMAASRGLYGIGYDVRSESHVLVFETGSPIGDMTLFVDAEGIHTIIWFGCASPATRLLQYAMGGILLAPPEPLDRPLRGW